MHNLLIVDNQAETYLKELNNHQPRNLEIFVATNPKEAEDCITDVNIILGRPDMVAQLLPKAEKLAWVQSTFAGVDALCKQHLRKDYRLTGVKGIFGPLMSEYVAGYILAFERQLFEIKYNQSERVWKEVTYRSLADLTIGIAGLGSIGLHVAKTANHFGMNVIGLKRSPGQVEHVAKLFTLDQIDTFLSLVDYLVLLLPDTPETNKIINKQRLKNMKPGSVIINVGRGATIDQDDLVWALQSKTIKGAVLDVFEEEPLPQSSPIWKLPNVHVTPHIAATSFPHQVIDIFTANLHNFETGQPLKFLIDFQKGY
ncbi:MAG: D-2-hydroxyacid dehydrogenase [Proteobacteria bacterium]|nr:D-2-hydroxyacid dehydrogenase [Pseudomonadota bacterium]